MELIATALDWFLFWCAGLAACMGLYTSAREFSMREFTWTPPAAYVVAGALYGLDAVMLYGKDGYRAAFILAAVAFMLCAIESFMAVYGSQIFPPREPETETTDG